MTALPTSYHTRPNHVAIGSIVIRCHEFERMSAFWQEVLHYVVVHANPNGGFVILGDPGRKGPNV